MNKPVILLIDDEKIILNSLLNQLKRAFTWQFQYEAATSIDEAKEIIEELEEEGSPVKLIVTDWPFEDVNSLGDLKEMCETNAKIAKIVLSNYYDTQSSQAADKLPNMKLYMTKPYEEDELIESILEVLAEELE